MINLDLMKIYQPASYASMITFIVAGGISLNVSENFTQLSTDEKLKGDKTVIGGSMGTTYFAFNIIALIFAAVHLGLIGWRQMKDAKFLQDRFNMVVLLACILATIVASFGLNYSINTEDKIGPEGSDKSTREKNGKLRGPMGTAYFALNIATLAAAGSVFIYQTSNMFEMYKGGRRRR